VISMIPGLDATLLFPETEDDATSNGMSPPYLFCLWIPCRPISRKYVVLCLMVEWAMSGPKLWQDRTTYTGCVYSYNYLRTNLVSDTLVCLMCRHLKNENPIRDIALGPFEVQYCLGCLMGGLLWLWCRFGAENMHPM
jgi:hypothetical protein